MNTVRTTETVSAAPRSTGAKTLSGKAVALAATIAASIAACANGGRDDVSMSTATFDGGKTDGGFTSADGIYTYDSGRGFPEYDAGSFPVDTGSRNPNPNPADTLTVDTGADTGSEVDTGMDTGADTPDTGATTDVIMGAPCSGAESVLGKPCETDNHPLPPGKGIVVCDETNKKLKCD